MSHVRFDGQPRFLYHRYSREGGKAGVCGHTVLAGRQTGAR